MGTKRKELDTDSGPSEMLEENTGQLVGEENGPATNNSHQPVKKKRRLGQKARKNLASNSKSVPLGNVNGLEQIHEDNGSSIRSVGNANNKDNGRYVAKDLEQMEEDEDFSTTQLDTNDSHSFVAKSKSSVPHGIVLAIRKKTDTDPNETQSRRSTFYFTNNANSAKNSETGEALSETPNEQKNDEPEAQESEDDTNSNDVPFSSITFNAKLGSPDTLIVLKRFIKQMEAVNDDGSEVLSSEMIANVSGVKILEVLDPNLEGKLASACIVFNALHTLIMRSLTDTPFLKLNCEEVCRNLLNDYLPLIQRMLTDRASLAQLKVVFKLLTVVVSMTGVFGQEILSRVQISNSVIERLTQTGDPSNGLRKTFIHFVMSFFIEKNTSLIVNLLEKKELLASIIPGLVYDEAPTVYLVLTTFRTRLFEDISLRNAKGKKVALFNSKNLSALIKVLTDWEGPNKVEKAASLLSAWSSTAEETNEEEDEDKKVVAEAAYQLLEEMCTSRNRGIIFNVSAFGLHKEEGNRNLNAVLNNIVQPWIHKDLSKLVAKILAACPDLIKTVMKNVNTTIMKSRGNASWVQAVDFIKDVIEEMTPLATIRAQLHELTVQQVNYGVLLMCMPIPAINVFQEQAMLNASHEARHAAFRLLLVIMRKANEFCDALVEWGKLPKRQAQFMLLNSIAKSFPKEKVIWSSWEKFVNPADKDKDVDDPAGVNGEHVICVLDVLMQYQRRRPLTFKFGQQTWGTGILLLFADIDAMGLTDQEEDGYQKSTVQLKLFDLLLLVSRRVIQENKAAFIESLGLLFRLTNHPSPVASDRASALLVKFLTATDVFKGLSAEVVVWLNCYQSMPPPDQPAACQLMLEALVLALTHPKKYKDALQNAVRKADGLGDSDEDNGPANSSLSPMLPCISEAIGEMKEEAFEKVFVFINLVVIKLLYTQHSPALVPLLIDEKYLDVSVCDYMRNWLSTETAGKWAPMAAPFNPDGVEYKLSVAILGLEDMDPASVVKAGGDLEEGDSIQNMLLFNLTMFHLSRMISLRELTTERKNKCAEAITALLSIQTDSTKKKECILNLFAHPVLLNSFAPFRIDDDLSSLVTDFVVTFVRSPDIISETDDLEKLIAPYKEKLVREVVAGLTQEKGSCEKQADYDRPLDTVRLFRLDSDDIVEILDVLKNFKTKDFLSEQKLSVWGLLLVELLEKTVSLSKNDPTLSDLLPKRILFRISVHLENMLAMNDVSSAALEESFLAYLQQFPQSIHDIQRSLFIALLNSPRTTDSTGLFLLSKEPYIFGKMFVKNALENNIIMEKADTVFTYATAAFGCNIPLVKKSTQFLKSLYDVHQEKIIKGIKKPKKVQKWMIDNGDLIMKLITEYMSEETCDELCEDIKRNAKKHSLCGEVQLAFLECVFVKNSRTKGERAFADFSNALLVLMVLSASNEKTNLNAICTLLCKYVKQVTDVSAWDSLKRGPIWRQFKMNALKLGLESSATDFDSALLLQTLAECLNCVYKENEAGEEIAKLFEMAMSHSQFLTVMLSSQPSKLRLVELLCALVSKNPSVMSQSHVPVLFSAYNATLSLADQKLLRLLKAYETNRVSLHKCRPYLWGEAAVNLYCIAANRPPSLDYQPSMAEVVQVIEVGVVEDTITKFPQDRKLNLEEHEDLPDVYDPAFFLPLFGHLLAPESVVNYLKFVHSGGLAMTVACLSSSSTSIRAAAYYVLSLFYFHVEASGQNREKLWWMQFVNTARNGIIKLESGDDVPQLPGIVTTFLARMSLVISEPLHNNFPALTRVLMATFAMNLGCIPNFLSMFYNSEHKSFLQRHWILAVIRDGLRTAEDWHLCEVSFLSNNLLGYYSSTLAAWDEKSKLLILQVLNSATKVAGVSQKLVRFAGFFPWLHETIRTLSSTDKDQINAIIQIVTTMQASKPTDDREPYQITQSYNVNITLAVMSILPKLPLGMDALEFKDYLTVFEAANSVHNLATKDHLVSLVKFAKNILGAVAECEDLLKFGNKYAVVGKPSKSSNVFDEAKACLRRIIIGNLAVNDNKEVAGRSLKKKDEAEEK